MTLSIHHHRPWIKICGITDPETALACADLGADAIGLVFFEKSPRNLSRDRAADISNCLPQHLTPVGVFVDQPFDAIMDTVQYCGLKAVQLHGRESPAMIRRLLDQDLIVIKALFAGREPFLSSYKTYGSASFFLAEYGKGTLPGGNAESWDYAQCSGLKFKNKLILAGGLDASNVALAVKNVQPAAVDVSSGIEKKPGVKDLKKTEAFILQIRSR